MPEHLKLTNPWLVAVWPGMGHVAVAAGYQKSSSDFLRRIVRGPAS